MKVGDLICYNAAGMKYKTLGLVLEIEPPRYNYGRQDNAILIQWCVVGTIMPRRDYRGGGFNEKIKAGEMIWHTFGKWFEVSK
mgnify:CR=1 FL=1